MKLYLISQDVTNGYDTYDSAVVLAESEDDAKLIHPDEFYDLYDEGFDCDDHTGWYHEFPDGTRAFCYHNFASWSYSPDQVTAELIGTSTTTRQRGVVLASFNAG